MRSFSHLTPRYIYHRLEVMFHEWNNPNWPWLTRDIIDILETWLKPTDIGLEFGSGRSTNWFTSRISHLTSIEENRDWYKRVYNQIENKAVDYFLHEDGTLNSATSNYVNAAQHISLSSLDFCLIDGASRDHCALAILDKLKSGGILIIDDVERYIPHNPKSSSPNARDITDGYATKDWATLGDLIKNWRFVWTSNGIKDTAFWIKP